MNFYEAWIYLQEHMYFADRNYLLDGKVISSMFSLSLTIDVVKVNPLSETIEEDEDLNTETRVWLESGPQYKENGNLWNNSHDTELDCGGTTFELAIIELANLVEKIYPIERWGRLT